MTASGYIVDAGRFQGSAFPYRSVSLNSIRRLRR